MNFYKRHIGDYLKDTAHLSLLEHGIYSRLLDVYYTRESAIPEEMAARLIGARSKEEIKALNSVLSEFFVLRENAWYQSRCEAELTIANDKATRNREVGKMGGRPRKKESGMVAENNPDGFENEPKDNPSQTPDVNTKTVKQQHTESNSARARCSETVRVVVDNPIPEQSAPDKSPSGAMAGTLRRLGVDVTSQHPTLLAWITDGFRIEDLQEAVEVARIRKPPPQRIPANYLDTVARTTRTESNTKGAKSESDTRNKPRRLSVAERATEARRAAERALDGELVGEVGPYVWPQMDVIDG